MTYSNAIKQARKVGAAHATGNALLAQTVATVSMIHPGVNAEMIYNGALKVGLTPKQVAALANDNPIAFGDLMFR